MRRSSHRARTSTPVRILAPHRGDWRRRGVPPIKGRAELSDILLLFIYLEIGAVVGIYFKTARLSVQDLIYSAMTALGRILIGI
jgi:hypothetical protein